MNIKITRETLHSAKLLVIGDLMLDRYLHGTVNRISPEAPVPVINVNYSSETLGGAGNVALNLSKFTPNVSLIALHNQDDNGDKIVDKLCEASIKFIPIISNEYKTIVKSRIMAQGQQLLRMDFEKPFYGDKTNQIKQRLELISDDIDAVLISDYGKGTLNNCNKIIKYFCELGKPIFIDPKGTNYEKYRGATLITPNRSEFISVMGTWKSEEDLFDKAHDLREMLDLNYLLLTRSEEGMTLFYTENGDKKSFHVNAPAKEVYDVTGAGDTVISMIALMCSSGYSIFDAVVTANRAASVVVERLGAAHVTLEDINP